MKDLDVLVKVGTTDHPAKIDSLVRLSEELVDTKSLRVKWIVNNKKEVVDTSSVRQMYSLEVNNQKRRSTKPANPPFSNVIADLNQGMVYLRNQIILGSCLLGYAINTITTSIATHYLQNKWLQRWFKKQKECQRKRYLFKITLDYIKWKDQLNHLYLVSLQ